MSSNITLINKLNPTRFDQNDKLKIKIDELCAKSFKNLNSTSEKELIKYLVDNIKLSIDYEVKDTKKNDPTDLEIFYKKYLSQLNDLINMKKKTLDSPSEHTSYNPLDILKQIKESIQKTIKDIDLKKRIMESFNAIKDTIISFYETIKNETINIFNGTTFSKIFHAGYELFLGPSESTKETSARIDSLIKDVEELGKTIASSKFFLHTIIEKVKEQGKLKIVNKLNNNPNHPEYQSSFPDLQVMNPKKENTWYPFIDENFDTEEKKGTFKVNQKFKDRMNRSIEKSHYNYFTNNDIWTVSNTSNSSSKNVFSTISNFQKLYENLRFSKELNKDFMTDFNSSLFVIDGNVVFSTNKQEMMDKFKKFVPNIMDQKLISAYAHPKVLGQSYFQLISEHPELNQYQIVKSRNFYKITHIDNNQIKLVATNLSDLRSTDENIVRPYHSFGVRTSIILSDKDLPIIKYSNFVH